MGLPWLERAREAGEIYTSSPTISQPYIPAPEQLAHTQCHSPILRVSLAKALTQLAVSLDQVHLGEDVDVGQFHVQHGGERGAENRDELARVRAVVRIHQMHRSQLDSEGTKGQREVRPSDESICLLLGQSEKRL